MDDEARAKKIIEQIPDQKARADATEQYRVGKNQPFGDKKENSTKLKN